MEFESIASANSTIPAQFQQQVSGKSAFWALAALALSAVAQPSINGYIWSGNLFEESLSPHRSSPFICVTDAAVEIMQIAQITRNRPSRDQSLVAAKPTALMVKLTIFTLGVLPQVIKLFSMRGIATTQAIATAYLLSSTISFVRGLYGDAANKDMEILPRRLKHILDQIGSSIPEKRLTAFLL